MSLIDKDKHLSSLQVFFILILAFPYLGIQGVNFDTQPWAYAFSLFLLFFFCLQGVLRIPDELKTIFLISIFILVVKIFIDLTIYIPEGYGFDIGRLLRQIFSYSSVFVVFLAVFRFGKLPSRKLYFFVLFIWFAAGVLQLVNPDIFDAILPRVSTTSERGVTGLASEPTHYARHMALLLVLGSYLKVRGIVSRRDIIIVSFLVMFNVIFIARSFTGLAFMMPGLIAVAWSLYRHLKIIIIPSAFLLLVFLVFLIFQFLPESRIVQLLIVLIEDPDSLSVYGAYRRITNAPTSIYVGFFQYFGLGLGFGRELLFVPSFSELNNFSSFSVNPHGGVVGIVYLAGVFGLPYVMFWLGLLFGPIKHNRSSRNSMYFVCLAAALFLLCFFEGTTANPFLIYVISVIYKYEYLTFSERYLDARY